MRDAHLLVGPKLYYAELDDAHTAVLKSYPSAKREGSIGAWCWMVGDTIVAEAWIHATRPGWWLRIK